MKINLRYALPVAATAVAALVAVPVEYAHTHSVLEAAQALGAVLIAGAVAWLVASLPGVTPGGLAAGGFFVTAGIVSWSFGRAVWGLLLVGAVGFAIWSRPWVRYLRPAVRLGGSWLGVAYWILGIVGAALVGKAGFAGARLLYAGAFGLAVLAVLAGTLGRNRPGHDLSVGVTAAFLIAIAVLLVAGSGNLFDPTHAVVAGEWGKAQNYRFWGGWGLLYHPNSLAGIAVAAAVRIGLDRRFAPWQRLAATVLAGFVVDITNSRTGFVFLGGAAAVHAALLWWRRRREVAELPEYPGRSVWAAVAAPFVVLAVVLAVSGGTVFLGKQRYGNDDVTSGRTDTWKAVGHEWVDAGIPDKLFGDTKTIRAVVRRPSAGNVDLTTDNAAVGALRRGGVLGELAFLLGLGLLIGHAFRRRAPAWLLVVTVASLPTIAVADWLLGGTGGTLWILLVAGEAFALLGGATAPAGAIADPAVAAEPASP